MVGDNGDGVRGPLEVLAPFFQSQDYCKKFAIIDVVVALGEGKGVREVCAGV